LREAEVVGRFTDFVDAVCGAVFDLVDAVALSIEIVEEKRLDASIEGGEVVGIAGGDSEIVVCL